MIVDHETGEILHCDDQAAIECAIRPDIDEEMHLYQPMPQELVFLLEGPRGNGKSAGASYLGFDVLDCGGEVLSNIPLDGQFGDTKRLISKPLDTTDLMQFDKVRAGVTYLLDEFDKICGARWTVGSNVNRALDWLATQIRKFEANVLMSAQNRMMIDPYWRMQIDVLIKCRDLAHTPFGKQKKLMRGAVVILECFDISGVVTGQTYEEMPVSYGSFKLNCRALWGKYPTKKYVGADEILKKLVLKKQVVEFGYDDDDDVPDERPDLSNVPFHGSSIDEYMGGILHDLALKGHKEISGAVLDNILKGVGLNIDPRERGLIMDRLGVSNRRRHKGRHYDLSTLDLGGFYGLGDLTDKDSPAQGGQDA